MDSYVHAQYSFQKAKFGPNPTQDKKNGERSQKIVSESGSLKAERKG